MPDDPCATAASVPAEGTWNQVLAEDAAQSIDRMTTAAQRTCRSWITRYRLRLVCHLPKGHDGSHRAYAPDAAVRWVSVPNPDKASAECEMTPDTHATPERL